VVRSVRGAGAPVRGTLLAAECIRSRWTVDKCAGDPQGLLIDRRSCQHEEITSEREPVIESTGGRCRLNLRRPFCCPGRVIRNVL